MGWGWGRGRGGFGILVRNERGGERVSFLRLNWRERGNGDDDDDDDDDDGGSGNEGKGGTYFVKYPQIAGIGHRKSLRTSRVIHG